MGKNKGKKKSKGPQSERRKGSTFTKAAKLFTDSVTMDTQLNEDDLPFYLCHTFDGTDGKPAIGEVTWRCVYDEEKTIRSIYKCATDPHVEERIMDNLEHAKMCRDELLSKGWTKAAPPNINFRQDDGRPINRKQARYALKQMKKGNMTWDPKAKPVDPQPTPAETKDNSDDSSESIEINISLSDSE